MPQLPPIDSATSLQIQCILSDVDGVMTDGSITYDSAGNEIKQFSVRDGLGIKRWMQSGFEFGIITARQSPMVQRRAEELGITRVAQGAGDKLTRANDFLAELKMDLESVCYIGDDLPDLPVMKKVGLAVAPADAAWDVLEQADWVLSTPGGKGAVRETVERLLRAKGRWSTTGN